MIYERLIQASILSSRLKPFGNIIICTCCFAIKLGNHYIPGHPGGLHLYVWVWQGWRVELAWHAAEVDS